MVPVEYVGTGMIPKEGLYNTVMKWNMRCRYADALTLTFTTGSDSTTFHGTEGWLRICRNKIESEPASLATAALQVSRFGVMGAQPHAQFPGFHTRPGHAGKPHRLRRAHRPQDPLGSGEGNHRGRHRGRPDARPAVA